MLLIPLSVLLTVATPSSGVAGFCPPECCASTQPAQVEVIPTQAVTAARVSAQTPTSASVPTAPTANVGPGVVGTTASSCCAPGCCAS